MSTEPTEEQWRAANNIADGQYRAVCKIADVAHLLAAREAKLRDELSGLDALDSTMSDLVEVTAERDTLRARVAELESLVARCTAQMTGDRQYIKSQDREIMRLEVDLKAATEREAQHLADIKACVDVFRGLIIDTDKHGDAASAWKHAQLARALLARLAHYDDAKADAPTEDMQAWANGSCPELGCSLANPHEQGVACVKPTAEGGEG